MTSAEVTLTLGRWAFHAIPGPRWLLDTYGIYSPDGTLMAIIQVNEFPYTGTNIGHPWQHAARYAEALVRKLNGEPTNHQPLPPIWVYEATHHRPPTTSPPGAQPMTIPQPPSHLLPPPGPGPKPWEIAEEISQPIPAPSWPLVLVCVTVVVEVLGLAHWVLG